MFRLKSLLISLGLATLALIATGCLGSDSLSAIEYNNQVVGILNDTSAAIEESTANYDEGIPNIVTESSSIDVTSVETAYTEAVTKLETAQNVLSLTSQTQAQQTAIQTEFKNYLNLAQAYLETYKEMVDYYKNETYKTSLDNVAVFDQDLHSEYNAFIKSNNDLVDILAEYVK